MPHDEASVARVLAALSIGEIVDAAAASRAPYPVRRAIELVAGAPSRRLGKILARFDAHAGEAGLGIAAREVMRTFGARVDVKGSVPSSGAVLVVTNHPGAYDSLATMASLGRDDVALVAADRPFLRAMPHLCDHFVFVADPRTSGSAMARFAGLRAALAWLGAGRVLVQYGAGAIEPDAGFTSDGDDVLGVWSDGTGVLAQRAASLGATIVPALVSGVHSRRAKRLPIVRWAERRGITTIAPLLQATLPGFRDVAISVRFGAPVDREAVAAAPSHAARTALLRVAVAALRERTDGVTDRARPSGARAQLLPSYEGGSAG